MEGVACLGLESLGQRETLDMSSIRWVVMKLL